MTFDLVTIAGSIAIAFLYGTLLPARWRSWALCFGSVVVIFWLQPPLSIRFGEFLFPLATVLVTILAWWGSRERGTPWSRADFATAATMGVIIIGLSLFRYVPAAWRLTAGRPPNPLWIIGGLAVFSTIIWTVERLTEGDGAPLSKPHERNRQPMSPIWGAIVVIVLLLFVLIKFEPAATMISGWWRSSTGQDVTLANRLDLNWLGYSYVAFRLLHTLRDRQTGQLPALSLREYITYVVFFPAFISGPIDRAERFVDDLRQVDQLSGLDGARWRDAAGRITMGLFKKFVIADSLALGLALNPTNAEQVTDTAGLWLLLYGYALRLFFDFSGYSDIAIGIGLLFGIRLPENFDRPYLQDNITAFWQRWHMTLSNWARFYIFSPLSRSLLRRKPRPSPILIVLVSQLATMIVIGLWHGVTINYLIWGIWHGLGLFVHKRWSDQTRRWMRQLKGRPGRHRLWRFFAWAVTFHYVVVGWVWFVLPEPRLAWQTLLRLFGIWL